MRLHKKNTIQFTLPSTLEAFETFLVKKGIGENAKKGEYRGWYNQNHFEFHHKFTLMYANVSERQDYYLYKGHVLGEKDQLRIEIDVSIRWVAFMIRNLIVFLIVLGFILRKQLSTLFTKEFELNGSTTLVLAILPIGFTIGVLFAHFSRKRAIRNLQKEWEKRLTNTPPTPE